MQNNEGLFSLDHDPTLKSARFLAFLLSLQGVGSAKALKLASTASDMDEVARVLGINNFSNMFVNWVLPESEIHLDERLVGFFDDTYHQVDGIFWGVAITN